MAKPPPLTLKSPEELHLARILASAKRRSALADLKSGEIDLRGFLILASLDDAVGNTPVLQVLRNTKGLNRKSAVLVAEKFNIANRRIRYLTGPYGSKMVDNLLNFIYPPAKEPPSKYWPYFSNQDVRFFGITEISSA